jgi:hypothetical protein
MPAHPLLLKEIQGSLDFFLDFTNLDPLSPGYGLTVDSNRNPAVASIASTGFALSAWVIAAERSLLSRQSALEITRGTLRTLLTQASHQHGFFAHFLHMDSAQRHRKCEFSTIDTALCLNGVITAAAYFQDAEVSEQAEALLRRVDWNWLVFERQGRTLFHMAYNPDRGGDYVAREPGLLGQWDMAAEQKMMYLQAAPRLAPDLARRLYQGFERETGLYEGKPVIFNPGGSLFAYLFSEAWLDLRRWRDPAGVDWFENTRLAALANRSFCIAQSDCCRTYHPASWGLSAGDSPWGYDVSGAPPCRDAPRHNGTVSIYSALSCLPFTPGETLEMLDYLHRQHPAAWGRYGFFDAYHLDAPLHPRPANKGAEQGGHGQAWYSQALYGIDKGCSLLMLENHLTGLIWNIYTQSIEIQHALAVLAFTPAVDSQESTHSCVLPQ